jgi:nucleoside-diphosphate-sugar epimerase
MVEFEPPFQPVWKWCAHDFTNIHDIMDGLLLFTQPWWMRQSEGNPPKFRYYNFGTGKATTVERLAQMVILACGSSSTIQRGVAAEHEGLEHMAKVYKAGLELNWHAWRTLQQAVNEYVQWRKGQPEPFLI